MEAEEEVGSDDDAVAHGQLCGLGNAVTVDERLAVVEGGDTYSSFLVFERTVLLADAKPRQLDVLRGVGVRTAESRYALGQFVQESLGHALILVQVDEVWHRELRGVGCERGAAGLGGGALLGLGDLLLPRLFHLVNHALVLFHLRELVLELLHLGGVRRGPGSRGSPDVDTLVSEQLLEPGVLLLQETNRLVGRVLVLDDLVLNLLGAISVPEGRERLFVVDVGRRQRANHNSLGVSAERVLKHHREHRVTVRHKDLLLAHGLVGERGNHVTQRREGLIDGTTLLEPVARGTGTVGTLGPRKVDQVDFGNHLGLALTIDGDFGKHDTENGVRARRRGVHLRRRDGAVHRSFLHLAVDGIVRVDGVGLEPRNVDAHLARANFESLFVRVLPLGRVQKVAQLLVINLKHCHRDLVRHVWILFALLAPYKEVLANDGNNAFIFAVTNHRVTFPGTRLPVRE